MTPPPPPPPSKDFDETEWIVTFVQDFFKYFPVYCFLHFCDIFCIYQQKEIKMKRNTKRACVCAFDLSTF